MRSGAWAEEGSPLNAADRAMLVFAVKLAREPRAMTRGDVEALRAAGFSDTGVHDVVQIAGFFSYYNRIADGLGIDPEPPSSGH
ncbi:MAG TPA: peroxidase [Armatimonadota bacterium]|nr:peroxidase [Armatimonadota bacterium]